MKHPYALMLKTALRALLPLALLFVALPGSAQSFPTRPVSLIVPYPPGGGADIVARAVAHQLSLDWKQPVIVESKPGAGTTIGAAFVARAQPDGYTLLLSVTQHAIAPSLFKNLPYDYLTSLAAVSPLSDSPFILVTSPNSPIKTFPQLMEVIKQKGSSMNFGSSGLASVPHLAGEMLNQVAGAKVSHIPYPGTAPAFAALLGGQIDYLFGDTSVLPTILSGKVKALAVTTAKRSPKLPDVPTISEFLPGFVLSSWVAVEAPAGTPRPVVEFINASIQKAFKTPALMQNYAETSKEALYQTPEEFAAFKAAEVKKFQKLVSEAGLKLE